MLALSVAARLDHGIRCQSEIPPDLGADIAHPGYAPRQHRHAERIMFAPVQLLDPLRLVHGTRSDRYDCPDLATLDRHITHLRRRIARLGGQLPAVAEACRADIDRLLDHRSWLTLPTAVDRSVEDGADAGRVQRPRPADGPTLRRSAA
jgi:hypothetical protein